MLSKPQSLPHYASPYYMHESVSAWAKCFAHKLHAHAALSVLFLYCVRLVPCASAQKALYTLRHYAVHKVHKCAEACWNVALFNEAVQNVSSYKSIVAREWVI